VEFQEANRRYANLRQRYENGSLSAEEFDALLEEMMVEDGEGRWWAKSRETGEWHYYDDESGAWIRDTPPGYHRTPATDEPRAAQSYAPPNPPTPPPSNDQLRPPGANVPGYLLPASIAATLLCCLPTGIAAIVYSAQANSKSQQGDTAGATQAVKNAQLWLWISAGAGLIVYFLAFTSGFLNA
jgi:hypothetical protein